MEHPSRLPSNSIHILAHPTLEQYDVDLLRHSNNDGNLTVTSDNIVIDVDLLGNITINYVSLPVHENVSKYTVAYLSVDNPDTWIPLLKINNKQVGHAP